MTRPRWYAITLRNKDFKERTAIVRAYDYTEAKQQVDDSIVEFEIVNGRRVKSFVIVGGRPAFAKEVRLYLSSFSPDQAKPFLEELEQLEQAGHA